MRSHKSRIGGGDKGCTVGSGALSGTTITGTTGSAAADGVGDGSVDSGEGEVAAGGGEGAAAGVGSGGVRIGLVLCDSPPLVAQPASNVQQMPNASQKVAELFESRIVEKSTGFEPV
jgi:hypothetical protein